MAITNQDYAFISKVVAWEEYGEHHQIYWFNEYAFLSKFRKDLLAHLNLEHGQTHKIRASVIRRCTAVGTHTMNRNSGYMFQITQTLRT